MSKCSIDAIRQVKNCECGKVSYIKAYNFGTFWGIACECGIKGLAHSNARQAVASWNNKCFMSERGKS